MTLQSELKRRIEALANDFATRIVELTAEVIVEHLRRPAAPATPPPRRAAPRRVSAARILALAGARPQGISAAALRSELGYASGPLPRALRVLLASGRVKEVGSGKDTRYQVAPAVAPKTNGTHVTNGVPAHDGTVHTVRRGGELLFG